MQSLHTRTAMGHAELSIASVWDHFVNMGGIVGEMEVEAYLHGLMVLSMQERDCVAQAVNELLDDRAMTGSAPCCRAPYSYSASFDAHGRTSPASGAPGGRQPGRRESSPIARPDDPVPLRPRSHRAR